MSDVSICNHPEFQAAVAVARLEDIQGYMADITINCLSCGMPFKFVGLPSGLHFKKPMVSVTGMELRAPIEPVVPTLPVPKKYLEIFDDLRSSAREADHKDE